MDLKLANDVVYAILGTVVVIFLVVYTARIVKLRAEQPRVVVEPSSVVNTSPWPAVAEEAGTRPIGKA